MERQASATHPIYALATSEYTQEIAVISSKPAKYFTVSGALAATLVLFACDSGGNQQVHSDRDGVELVLLRFDATKAVFVGELCSLEQRRSDKIALSIAATPSVAHFTAPALLGSSNALSLVIFDRSSGRTSAKGAGVVIVADWREPSRNVSIPGARWARFLNDDVVMVMQDDLRWSLWSATKLLRIDSEARAERFIPLAASSNGDTVLCWSEPSLTPYTLHTTTGVRELMAKSRKSGGLAVWSPSTSSFLADTEDGVVRVSQKGEEKLELTGYWLEGGPARRYVLTSRRESFRTQLRDVNNLQVVIGELPLAMAFYRFTDDGERLYANRIKDFGREESVWQISPRPVNQSSMYDLTEPHSTKFWLRQRESGANLKRPLEAGPADEWP